MTFNHIVKKHTLDLKIQVPQCQLLNFITEQYSII